MRSCARLAGCLAVLLGASLASASVIGYVEPGTGRTDLAGYGASGFKFTVSTPVEVTDLGFFALAQGGGDTPHVLLWNVDTSTKLYDTGNLGAALSEGWHYQTLSSPVTLAPGTNYEVSAEAYWVPSYTSAGSFTIAPEISSFTFVKSAGGWGGWTAYSSAPLSTTASPVSISANFKYNVVPEPFVLAPLATGLLMLRRRRA